ncbi:response regulator [Ramlibacter sp. XY19]|uniref:response regulator n=1 Tax=Ramlibacter paludis TaxID=2908000 RepID=UPI0023DC7ABE|nr:response regulator [Ramlibacter paludis]MCG2592333.1 response regulator [Ramlibacter paludis]
MSRIFVVEDEQDIAPVLVDYLRAAGLAPRHFADGEQALQAALADPPDLVLLDVMLPGRSGLEVLRALRKEGSLPVILLTARVEEVDRLLGLELGADDYICKPFSPREVVARVKAVLRRAVPAPPGKGPHLDETQGVATLAGQKLALTRKEFQLLAVLARRPGRIFSRPQLLELVYPDALDTSERVLDSHVKNLRRKLSAAQDDHEWIRSVYGVGFSFEAS